MARQKLRKINPVEREQAEVGNIELKEKGSVDWCWQFLSLVRLRWQQRQANDINFLEMLNELETQEVYNKVPPTHPYGSIDKLLYQEIGLTYNEVIAILDGVAETERLHHELLQGNSCEIYSLGVRLSTAETVAKRAEENGLSIATQRKIDRIVRDGRYDLLSRITFPKVKQNNSLSISAAYREVTGQLKPKRKCLPKDPQSAANRILKDFQGNQEYLKSLLERLSSSE